MGSEPQYIGIINAIGLQWKFIGVICATFLLYVYRIYIGEFFKNLATLRWSKTGKDSSLEMNRLKSEETVSRNESEVKAPETPLTGDPANSSSENLVADAPLETELPGLIGALIALFTDVETADKLFAKHLETVTEDAQRQKDKITYYSRKFAKTRDLNLLAELKKLAEVKELRKTALQRLFWSHQSIQDYSESLKIATELYDSSEPGEERGEWFGNIQLAKYLLGDREKIEGDFVMEISGSSNEYEKAELLKQLSEHYEKTGDEYKRMLALNLYVAIGNNPKDKLFSAAYSASANGDLYNSITLMHYLRLLTYEPNNGIALNNMGALFSEIGLKTKAIEYYESAAKQGETLPMANLGNLFADSGFANHANEQIASARRFSNPHKNIARLESRIAELKKDDEEKLEKMKKSAAIEAQFLKHFAEHSLIRSNKPGSGTWIDLGGIVYSLDEKIEFFNYSIGTTSYRFLILKQIGSGISFEWQKEHKVGEYSIGWDKIGSGIGYQSQSNWRLYRKKEKSFDLGEIIDLIPHNTSA